ncbi:hypothetical protein RCL1_001000 [Eukaryota sp. TZLM3-RCL]
MSFLPVILNDTYVRVDNHKKVHVPYTEKLSRPVGRLFVDRTSTLSDLYGINPSLSCTQIGHPSRGQSFSKSYPNSPSPSFNLPLPTPRVTPEPVKNKSLSTSPFIVKSVRSPAQISPSKTQTPKTTNISVTVRSPSLVHLSCPPSLSIDSSDHRSSSPALLLATLPDEYRHLASPDMASLQNVSPVTQVNTKINHKKKTLPMLTICAQKLSDDVLYEPFSAGTAVSSLSSPVSMIRFEPNLDSSFALEGSGLQEERKKQIASHRGLFRSSDSSTFPIKTPASPTRVSPKFNPSLVGEKVNLQPIKITRSGNRVVRNTKKPVTPNLYDPPPSPFNSFHPPHPTPR